MADSKKSAVYVPVYSGRKEIFVDESEINSGNIVSVLQEAFKVHSKNRAEIDYLEKYERGITPIQQRVKDVRPEINFKVTENHAHEISTFKVGYVFSSPISYVQRAKRDINSPNGETANADDNGMATLNEMMAEEGKAAKDQKLAKNFVVCGLGYKIALPKKVRTGKAPFDVLILDPKTTFVAKSNDIYKRPVLGVSYSVNVTDGSTKLGAYTDKYYFELTGDATGQSFRLIETKPNPLGIIPIVEYKNDYECMGCFERVLPLLDALNDATSDRLNGLAQFIQSFLWMDNVDLQTEEIEKLSDKLALLTKSEAGNPATVKYLTASLDQQQTQAFVDWMYEQILHISATPSRAQASGGNTGQAIVLGGGGWALAETAAKNTEQMFTESELQFLRVVLKIIQDSTDVPVEVQNVQLSDIDIKFSRNRTDGLVSKTQALLNLLTAGIDPLKSIDVCGLFSDPQTVYNDSKPYLKKWETVTQNASNNNPTPNEGE